MKYERIKFLVIALKSSVEVYAWAPKPYHKFMAFKVPGGGWRGRGRGGAPCPLQHLWGVISVKISPGVPCSPSLTCRIGRCWWS